MQFYCDDEYVLNILKKNISKILEFFELKVSDKITVKVLNFKDFKQEFTAYLNSKIDENVTGFIEDDKKIIVYLNYNDWQYTSHKNDTRFDYDKVIVHELVHMINSISCSCNYPEDAIWEGVAYYLAGQTTNSFYYSFAKLVEIMPHEELLKIINNEK